VNSVEDYRPRLAQMESALGRVPEPFYRLEESRSRETGGVGLAIAQAIAQTHGGTVTLLNRPAGGLRAKIVLPRVAG
jgi:signal transduction histidine kinase